MIPVVKVAAHWPTTRSLSAIGTILITVAACWAWIVPMCLDMYGSMSGAAAWMMTDHWNRAHLLLLWAMWVVMMVGMMLPSLVPIIMKRPDRTNCVGDSPGATLKFVGGYLTVWIIFSTVLAVAHRFLAGWSLVSPMMEAGSPKVAAVVLSVAGLYQFTPWKTRCLCACRVPTAETDRAAYPSRYLAGIGNGLCCVGCCWALMLVLFAGGVMKLWLNVALTGVILAEKVLGRASRTVEIFGALLVALGAMRLIS